MIKIHKDKFGPEIRYTNAPHKGLLTWKVTENAVLQAYRSDPTSFEEGRHKFPALYKSEEYKVELENCQGKKCCYCEKALSNGQIEHFRPKKAWQQRKGDPLTKPGYFWLAYRWDNFLLSCSDCNESGRKGNRFPIRGTRAINQRSPLDQENKVLINPAEEDPAEFISFNEDVPIGIDHGGRGAENIEIYDLKNRADLKSSRLEKYQLYKNQSLIARLKQPVAHITMNDIEDARRFLTKAKKTKEPFSGMIRENIKTGLL